MKKYLAGFFVLSLMLTGCASSAEESESVTVSQVEEASQGNVEAETEAETETSRESRYNQSISWGGAAIINPETDPPQYIVESAMVIYDWFEIGSAELDEKHSATVDLPNGDSAELYRLAYTDINKAEYFKKFLNSTFSDEITEKLMNSDAFIVGDDGYVYSLGAGRGKNILIEDVSYEVKELTENKCIINAVVKYTADSGEPENPKTFEFVCEKFDDTWKFTSFPYFY